MIDRDALNVHDDHGTPLPLGNHSVPCQDNHHPLKLKENPSYLISDHVDFASHFRQGIGGLAVTFSPGTGGPGVTFFWKIRKMKDR